jgi:hypothetical protein
MPDPTTPEEDTSNVAAPAAAPKPAAKPATRLKGVQIAVGVLLSPLAFLFGAYVVVLALPAVLPPMRWATPFAVALFAGVTVCWALDLTGVNPWQQMVQTTLLDELEVALGAKVEYDRVTSDSVRGTMTFENMRGKLPDGAGEFKARRVTVDAGAGYVLATSGYHVKADGMDVTVDPGVKRLEDLLRRPPKPRRRMTLEITDSRVKLASPKYPGLEADVKVERLHVVSEAGATDVGIGVSRLRLKFWGGEHDLQMIGGLVARMDDSGITLDPQLSFHDGGNIRGSLQGELGPAGGRIMCVIDHVDIGPIYARHRSLERLEGAARAQIGITGPMKDLTFDCYADLYNVSFFHPALMPLGESRALRFGVGALDLSATLSEYRSFSLQGAQLDATAATLTTDSSLRTSGDLTLQLGRGDEGIDAKLNVTVTEGVMQRSVTWNPLSPSSLSDLRPGILRAGDYLRGVNIDYEIDVQHLDVRCSPLSGVATGKLRGTAICRAGQPMRLTTGGRLEMQDGRFQFLGAGGTANLSAEFSPGRTPALATLEGTLEGQVGDTPLTIELGGSLMRPALTFTGMTMPPENLGRVIYQSGEFTEAQRRAATLGLCGPAAAGGRNPLLVRNTGKVRINFR